MINSDFLILFIEDDKNNANYVSEILKLHGYQVLIANDIEHAWIEFINKENSIDGIILDIIVEIGNTKRLEELKNITKVENSGALLYQKIRDRKPALPILIRTGELTLELKKSFKNQKNVLVMQKLCSSDFIDMVNKFFIEQKKDKHSVFVVHGHDSELECKVAGTLDKLGINAIILHEQADTGNTIIEKFESCSSDASAAIILLTADDLGKSNEEKGYVHRARQNVIFEMGYFMAKIGRERIFLLVDKDVEIPGDIDGMVYNITDDNVWVSNLCKFLKANDILSDEQ